MSKTRLNRRKLLSGIAVAGGAGSLVGGGTGALFTDEEVFESNTVRASKNVGGVLELEVTVEDLDNTGERYRISLPDGDSSTGTNNPAHIWLRTSECPTPLDLARDTQVEATVSYDGGTTETSIGSGSALRVLNEFRDGYAVGQYANDLCLKPGEEWVIDVEVTGVEGSYSDSDQLGFELEFFAQQCRYEFEFANPFEELVRCGKAISYVSFCGASGMEPTISNLNSTTEPTVVDWATNADVTYVVVYGGDNWTIYDYSDEQRTEGTAKTGDDPESDFFGVIEGADKSHPCDVADDKFGDGSGFDGESIKFEYDEVDEEFQKVS